MRPEVRRDVRASARFLDKLESYYGDDFGERTSTHEVLTREVIPYIFQAFTENWDSMPWVFPDDSRMRYHEFLGDEIPYAITYGLLTGIRATDPLYIVQEIELTDIIIGFADDPLEDPEGPTPNR